MVHGNPPLSPPPMGAGSVRCPCSVVPTRISVPPPPKKPSTLVEAYRPHLPPDFTMTSFSSLRRAVNPRHLAPLAGLLLLAVPALAQSAGEVARVVKIPTQAPGNPVLRVGDAYGRSMANVGDVNGDGIPDLLVGSANNDDGVTPQNPVKNSGAAWLVFLDTDGTAKQTVKYSNAEGIPFLLETADHFGKGVGALGDLDQDGVIDIVVGAPGDDDGSPQQGAIYILFLNSDGSIKDHQKISATEGGFILLDPDSEFGRGIAPLGDLDGDGVIDLAVSRMPRNPLNPTFTGTVYTLFLNLDGTIKNFNQFTLAELGMMYQWTNMFGFVLNSNDLDGDGLTDLIIGDIAYDGFGMWGAQNPNDGAVYLVMMNADGTPREARIISQDLSGFDVELDPGDHFGSGVTAIDQDYDGDGINDLVVGQKRADDSDPLDCTATAFCYPEWPCCSENGAAWVLFLNADFTVKGYQKISNLDGGFPYALDKEDRFGNAVASLGDLDGDGLPEVAVSSRFDDEAAPNGGMVYVISIANGESEVTSAWFEPDVTVGGAPLTVNFQDDSQGTNLSSWSWDFGDGGTSPEQYPTHTYDDPGTYSVTLAIDGDSGPDSITRDDLIVVEDAPFEIDFTGLPLSGSAPLTVFFSDRSLGSPIAWSWDFGDGGTSTLENPSHTYTEEGLKTVTLTVVDAIHGEGALVKTDYVNVGAEFLRFGCNPMVAGTLIHFSGTPRIGTTVSFAIANPFGTQPAGSSTWLRASMAPDPAYPCGFWKPNYGMMVPGSDGEILLALSPSPYTFTGTALGGSLIPGIVNLALPNNIGLIGTTIYSQGVIFDASGAFGVTYCVTDGLEFTIR